MSFMILAVGAVLAMYLINLGLTKRYTFCEKCGQKRWHRVTFGMDKDCHRNIHYDTETCTCQSCGHVKWTKETVSRF